MKRLAVFMAVCAVVVGASQAADFTVSAGSPVTLSAVQAAEWYGNVYVNDDFTIDGTICVALTNREDITIGANATHPVTVVVTNGARWIVQSGRKIKFAGKGGTLVVSAPTMLHGYGWEGGQFPFPGLGTKSNGDPITAYTNALGVVGHFTDVEVDANAESANGMMDIARLLPNGTASFRNVKNSNPNVDARVLFEGGFQWIQNDSNKHIRFTVENNAKIILESVDGNPIYIRSLAQDCKLFEGTGVLETRGDGDFILHHNRNTPDLRTITLSKDEGGSIVWGHHGRTFLQGVATWKIGADNILPYGPQTGPVILSCTESINATHVPIQLDLNGKTVRINGLTVEGKYQQFAYVTNSVVESGKLILGSSDMDAVLNGHLSDGVEIEKVGDGLLVVSNATVNGTLTVKAGSVAFVGSNTFANPVLFEEGTVLLRTEDNPANFIRRLDGSGDTVVPITGTPHVLYVKRGADTVNAFAGAYMDGIDISVEEGILRFAGMISDKWWRFTVRKAMNVYGIPNQGDRYELNAFALWPTNVTSSLKLGKGGMSASSPWGTKRMLTYGLTTNTTEFTSSMTSYSQLPKGTCMLGFGETCTPMDMDRSGRDYSGGADSLFGYRAEVCLQSPAADPKLRENTPSTWQHVIWRLGDDVPPAASYGLCRTYWSDGPMSWTLESSADGENWTLRDDHVVEYNVAATNVAVASLDEAYALSEFPFCPASMMYTASCSMWYNNGVPYLFKKSGTAADRLSGVKLRVANGATIDTDYLADSAISISELGVDCANGAGTITKFRPAANGTLALTGVDGKLPGRYVVPITLSEVVDAENFASWNVTLNGTRSPATTLAWVNGVLVANTSRGTIVVFR